MGNELLVSGVDGRTGRYSSGPESDEELVERVSKSPSLTPRELLGLKWWVHRYGLNDPKRALSVDVDPWNLGSAGWGALFSPEVTPEVREALQPLLSWRREQAGAYYKEFRHRPEQSKLDFLATHGASPGPANPRRVPYYLLLVGSPEAIPFPLQSDLDVQYAVGRIWFERPEDYARYAQSVVQAEKRPSERPKRLVFFAPANPGDEATRRASEGWIAPLARRLADKDGLGWEVCTRLGPAATKEQLHRLLGGGETPSLLFLASHGLRFPEAESSFQGALLCQDWPGPQASSGPVPENVFFAAQDVPKDDADTDLHGLVAFLFADFGGGTTEVPSELFLGMPGYRVPRPSVARLPQRLLSHPGGGALAIVSLIDRSWGMSFGWTEESRTLVFDGVMRKLLEGCPLGFAMEIINQRYAELCVDLAEMARDQERGIFPPDLWQERFSWLWRATQETRNLVVFGDPAVRLT